MSAFQGKRILVVGVANEKSIAWGIAEALAKNGAELAFTYVNESIEKRVRPLAESVGCSAVLPCDVQSDSDIDSLVKAIEGRWGRVDGLVHSVAFAERDDLQGRFSKTSRSGFKTALDISAYSLVALCGKFEELLKAGQGSVLTLTYLGSERVVPNYNVMGVAKAALEACVRYLASDLGPEGIRVNAVSAGPIRTLAASGIPQFRDLLAAFAAKAPLRRNVTQEDVAQAALFLLGAMSAGVTGEILYVDCGYNIMGS